MSADDKVALNVEPIGGTDDPNESRLVVTEKMKPDGDADKAEDTQQLEDLRTTSNHGIGKRPPYDPDLLAAFLEKNETHSVAIRKKSRYEVGYGFEIVPADGVGPDDAPEAQREVARNFWHGTDSRWQTGPRARAEPAVPEEVLELARQDFHAVGWCALEILTDTMGRPVGLAHVPANTLRVRTQRDRPGDRERGRGGFNFAAFNEFDGRGYVQVRHGQRRYFGEAGDRYRGQEVTIVGGDEPEVRYLNDEGDDREPLFVDSQNGDVATDAGALDNEPANELIFMRNPSVLPEADAYGVPDWVAAIRRMVGDEAAKDYNRKFFENDTIPRMIIKVSGGKLKEESKRDLRRMLRQLREEDHRAIVLELEEFKDELAQEDLEIEFKPLGQGISEDMSFRDYHEHNEHMISQVHEVPPVVLGITETSNRSNSDAQLHAFATEVIQPEQHKFAERLYRCIHQDALGVEAWTIDFITRGENQPREDARTAAEKIQAVNGAIPVNRALEMIGEDPLGDDVPIDGNATLLANLGDAAGGEGGDVEAADGRHPHAPPIGNKVGERDWADVKADLLGKDPIETANFDSSNLDEGLYDFGENELYISFLRDGGQSSLYVYTDVPTSEWQSLANAGSHGSYHYENVRLEYGYVEITNFHSRLPEGPMPGELPDDIPEGI